GNPTSPDLGNFACVPAGAISTGANAATVLTNGLDDPLGVAFGADNSVDLDNGALTTDDDVEFVLSGTYTAAAASRDTARTGNYASTGVTAIPTSTQNPAGTYAEGLEDSSAGPSSKVVIIHPDGSTQTITDPVIAHPEVAYDASNGQLVIISDGRALATPDFTKSNIQFWSITGATPTKVKQIAITDDANGATVPADGLGNLAVSADGHVAAILLDANGFAELNVYDNVSTSRAKIQSTLDYGAADCATLTNFTYGGTTVSANVGNKLIWLSNTKLMVELYSQATHVATGSNGLYIYDITQTQAQSGCDSGSGGTDGGTTIKQTGFRNLSNAPLAAGFKP
ncbi:MAG: hypothetical protein JO225_12915, partial [Candidatus Eremiobacteraeota bacterium]|nr:hypothetical protein [Candidatus Eremiobacteraeota bacterium]